MIIFRFSIALFAVCLAAGCSPGGQDSAANSPSNGSLSEARQQAAERARHEASEKLELTQALATDALNEVPTIRLEIKTASLTAVEAVEAKGQGQAYLYQAGGAGMALQLADEQKVRDERVRFLQMEKRLLEQSIPLNLAVQTAIRFKYASKNASAYEIEKQQKALYGSLSRFRQGVFGQHRASFRPDDFSSLRPVGVDGLLPPTASLDRPKSARTDEGNSPVNRKWLVGTWRPEDVSLRATDTCETDVIIRFFRNGSYEDGASQGRYSLDGSSISYINRKSAPDLAEDDATTFSPQDLPPVTARITKVGEDKFSEDGERWQRCRYAG